MPHSDQVQGRAAIFTPNLERGSQSLRWAFDLSGMEIVMTKILNAGLAALIAAGSFAAVATPAAAYDGYYGDYGHHDNTGAIIAGGIAGLRQVLGVPRQVLLGIGVSVDVKHSLLAGEPPSAPTESLGLGAVPARCRELRTDILGVCFNALFVLELEEINEQTDHRHRDGDGRNLVQLDLSAVGKEKHAASLTSAFSGVSVNVSRRTSTLRREVG